MPNPCCLLCGRPLKSKASIARGMGPGCAQKALEAELQIISSEPEIGSPKQQDFIKELNSFKVTKEAS